MLRHWIRPGISVHTIPVRFHRLFKNFHSRAESGLIKNVTDSYAGFTPDGVWTEAESAKRKLRILKYPYACRQGLGSNFPVSDILSGMFVGSWKNDKTSC